MLRKKIAYWYLFSKDLIRNLSMWYHVNSGTFFKTFHVARKSAKRIRDRPDIFPETSLRLLRYLDRRNPVIRRPRSSLVNQFELRAILTGQTVMHIFAARE